MKNWVVLFMGGLLALALTACSKSKDDEVNGLGGASGHSNTGVSLDWIESNRKGACKNHISFDLRSNEEVIPFKSFQQFLKQGDNKYFVLAGTKYFYEVIDSEGDYSYLKIEDPNADKLSDSANGEVSSDVKILCTTAHSFNYESVKRKVESDSNINGNMNVANKYNSNGIPVQMRRDTFEARGNDIRTTSTTLSTPTQKELDGAAEMGSQELPRNVRAKIVKTSDTSFSIRVQFTQYKNGGKQNLFFETNYKLVE